MTAYLAWVVVGIVAAFLARRWLGSTSELDERERTGLLLVAFAGAILGAYGLQLPADLLGWNAPPEAGANVPAGLPLGGRTLLGGILGGWLAVEAAKRAFRISAPTGDDFAVPLALALGFGRLGCMAAACCVGRACAPHALAYVDAHGTPRVPVQLAEAVFHFGAALALVVLTRRGALRGRRLAAYVALYALLRFALEFARLQPPLALGLTYHQYLCGALFALAATTWWRRRRRAAKPT